VVVIFIFCKLTKWVIRTPFSPSVTLLLRPFVWSSPGWSVCWLPGACRTIGRTQQECWRLRRFPPSETQPHNPPRQPAVKVHNLPQCCLLPLFAVVVGPVAACHQQRYVVIAIIISSPTNTSTTIIRIIVVTLSLACVHCQLIEFSARNEI